MMRRATDRGFTLIELLIVVAIIGIIGAILIPNMIDAIHKAKQKRTIADMRNTGNAWMSWLTDQVSAAAAGEATYFVPTGTSVSYDDLVDILRPSNSFFYQQEIPQLDGFGNPYVYWLGSELSNARVIVIAAACRDGVLDATISSGEELAVGPFVATDYNQDIIWADGYFLQWPAGKI